MSAVNDGGPATAPPSSLASGTASGQGEPRLSTVLRGAGGCLAVTIIVFGAVILLALTSDAAKEHLGEVIAVAVAMHALACLLFLLALVRRTGLAPQALGIRRPTWRLAHLLWQIPSALILLVAVQATMFAVLGGEDPVASGGAGRAMASLSPLFAVVGFLGVALLTPLWEELFFRALVLGAARRRYGAGIAVMLSAILFAAVHGVPILLPYLLTLGLILGFLRVFHGNIWAPVAMHVSINAIASGAVLAALV